MTVLFSDSFNRTNSATSVGSTDNAYGGTTKTYSIYGTAVYGISNNQLYQVSGSTADYQFAGFDAGVSNVSVQLTFSTVGGTDVPYIIFRATNATNYLMVTFNFHTPAYELYSISNSNFNFIAQSSVAPVNGDVVKVTANGSSITVNVNGTNVISATSTFNQTATIVGICGAKVTTNRFDDFIVSDLNTGSTGTTYTGSGTSLGNSNLTGTEKLILKATGTLQGTSNITSIEKSILKALGAAQGYSTLSSGETLIQQQGTTYTGGGTAQGNSTLISNENYRYKANGTLQGYSSLSSGETLILFTGNVYSASGTVTGYSTLSSQDKMTYKEIGYILGYSAVEVHEIISLAASGIAQGYSNVLLVEPKNEIVASIKLIGKSQLDITLHGKKNNSISLSSKTTSPTHLRGGIS